MDAFGRSRVDAAAPFRSPAAVASLESPAVRALVLTAALAAALAPALSGCASYDPHDRRVNARFACTDGRRLRVQFRLDRREAEVRAERMKPVTLPATGAARGRSYAGLGPDGGAYSLDGLGDAITWRAPGAAAVTCDETH